GSPGGYVQQLSDVLFGIISILAERAGTIVIGEDLGLVPHGFRKEMRGWGFYGYSVLQFEKTDTGHIRAHGDLRPQSLACFGTHDTPTLKGYWQGRDIDWWLELGWINRNQADRNRCDRNAEKRDLLSIGPATAPEGASEARNFESFRDSIHQSLACSPAAMVSVQLDDIFGLGEAQNLPGTIDEHPNWQRRYPISLEDYSTNAEFLNISQIMADCGRSPIIASPKETKNDG
ncbi:MAG: 4-alpha-glucanotransferase, partial [Paracoccaceae bacterium]